MYKEEILYYYRNPRNFGTLKSPTNKATLYNSLCGDVISMQVVVKQNKVWNVKFLGESCAISRSAASFLTDFVKGKSALKLSKMGEDDMMKLMKSAITPGRLKCLMLPLATLQKALQ